MRKTFRTTSFDKYGQPIRLSATVSDDGMAIRRLRLGRKELLAFDEKPFVCIDCRKGKSYHLFRVDRKPAWCIVAHAKSDVFQAWCKTKWVAQAIEEWAETRRFDEQSGFRAL